MNEKIRQLKEQARDFYLLQEDLDCSIKQLHELVDEKFAELIVRECAEICDQQGRVGWNDDRKAQARLDRDLIKEHFGVE